MKPNSIPSAGTGDATSTNADATASSQTIAKPNVISRLSDFEWTCLWMAIRYAMNRQTIAAATLPQDIIKNYYSRISANQKQSIVKDLKSNEEDWAFSGKAFGHEEIDRRHWIKLWKALDENCHYQVELIDGTKCTVFEANGKVVPLHKYIEEPYHNYFVPLENIRVFEANGL
jgi:hypothetical protein